MSSHFTYANPFSSIDVRSSSEKDCWLDWQQENVEQGFCLSPGLAAFSTTTDEDYEVTIVESDDVSLPSHCVYAVQVPFISESGQLHIRGGYADLDIPAANRYQSLLFVEAEGRQVEIRLGQAAASGVRLFHACQQYPRTKDFLVGGT